ncbi:MAG: hypothetical protein NBKEAIPA_00209 [Nitrospirae bacterium]|nr:hypothetical protein [Nitrospirota bacterium]MCE7963860.1 hypothetical protein [Nitrospira sp. NTP2]MCK6497975.1 hypothetical protein [Nitrospira sp.]MEB2339289.1 hypothetical protein [Nitrospirales bacterium]QOJ35532.1 MAG: hypothetical protein HRU82_11535 [Nitrospira sp.]
MKRRYTMLGAIGMMVLVTGCVAQHTCSSQDMIGMKEKGFAVDEINSLCTTYKLQDEAIQAMSQALQSEFAKSRQGGAQTTPVTAANAAQAHSPGGWAPQAATCTTQVGTCRLIQPVDRGLDCTCFTLYGQIPGVTQ